MAPFFGAILSLAAVTLLFVLATDDVAFPWSFAVPAACALTAASVAGGRLSGTAICSAGGGVIPFSLWLIAAYADTEGSYLVPFFAAAWIAGYFVVASLGAWLAASLARSTQHPTAR